MTVLVAQQAEAAALKPRDGGSSPSENTELRVSLAELLEAAKRKKTAR